MTLKEQLQHKINSKTKPLGSLGLLEKIALQVGLIQQTAKPAIEKPTMLVFAADHGLADEGVSPFPKEVTAQMVFNFINGGAAINVFCRANGLDLKVIDAGVDFDFPPHQGLINAKVAKGTKSILLQGAMSADECISAINKGKVLIQNLKTEGCNTVAFGEMGIGNTSSAALLMSKVCNISIEKCVGRGTGHDEAGLRKKTSILLKALSMHPNVTNPFDILATFGGFEIAMMTGAMLEAYQQGMVIIVDGFITTSALLVSQAINKEVLKNCIFSHQSDEQGHKLMLEFLNADPLLNLKMRLGEGSGAAVAFPIIKSAVSFLNEMASFEKAGVSNID
jgi:nicotinate-nucleotide--dimethylbenzimidazole phosphoribosyltransferase